MCVFNLIPIEPLVALADLTFSHITSLFCPFKQIDPNPVSNAVHSAKSAVTIADKLKRIDEIEEKHNIDIKKKKKKVF